MKVSIIITVCNDGVSFELALKSALAQTYRDIEVIVVDASSDGSGIDSAVINYKNQIRYIRQSELSAAGALNTGIEHMRGDIFTWLSHDALFLPEKTSSQVEYYTKLGKKDAILFSDYYLIDPEGRPVGELKFDHQQFERTPMLPLLNGCVNGSTIFLPRHILDQEGPFDVGQKFIPDYDLWNKILRRHEFFHQSKTLICRRIHPDLKLQAQDPGFVEEGNRLWIRMLDDRSATERVQLFGSSTRYYSSLSEFLQNTPYKQAAEHAKTRANMAIEKTLVSVIILLFSGFSSTLGAARSVLVQTHRNIELIIVGDADQLGQIVEFAESDRRVRLVLQTGVGTNSARKAGLQAASGDYIAFLDADGLYAPHKIERQLRVMEDAGESVSYSSSYVCSPESFPDPILLSAGGVSATYPEVLVNCPIFATALIFHRALIAEGLFPDADASTVPEVLSHVVSGGRRRPLALKDPLSVVTLTPKRRDDTLRKSIRELRCMHSSISNDPMHSCFATQIARLDLAIGELQMYLADRKIVGRDQNGSANERSIPNPYLPLAGDRWSDWAERHAKDFKPGEADSPWYDWAEWNVCAGNYEPALIFYSKLAEIAPDNHSVAYALGSCLAILGRFEEANALFSRGLPIPCGNGKVTYSTIVRLPVLGGSFAEPLNDPLPARTVHLESSAALDRANRPDSIYFVCCDAEYFNRFGPALINSVLRQSGVEFLIHVHVINPNEQTHTNLASIISSGMQVAISTETVQLHEHDLDQRRTYYACARFLILPELLKMYSLPILVADIDQLVIGSLAEFVERVKRHDISFIRFQNHGRNIISFISASVLSVSTTCQGFAFCQNLRNYILERFNKAPFWHLDQAALAAVHLSMREVKYGILPSSIMSSAPLVQGKIADWGPETLFWSVTASDPEHGKKLELEIFKSVS